MSAAQKRTPGACRAFEEQHEDSTPIVSADDQSGLAHSDDKGAFARIKAELAVLGFGLLESSDGFLILRWGWSRLAPDLRAAGAFLKQVGGSR